MGNTSPHQELKDKAQGVVRAAITSFDFASYGLDDVDEAKGEDWHSDLSLHIVKHLFGKDIK